MTPALLPGFHAYTHTDTRQPCILQTPNNTDYVQGMLVFGLGRAARGLIHEHYRPYCRRIKAEVQVDLLVPIGWQVERYKIWAHVWVWSNAISVDARFRATVSGWSIGGYLDINDPESALRIEPSAKGDERFSEDGSISEAERTSEGEWATDPFAWEEMEHEQKLKAYTQMEGWGGW